MPRIKITGYIAIEDGYASTTCRDGVDARMMDLNSPTGLTEYGYEALVLGEFGERGRFKFSDLESVVVELVEDAAPVFPEKPSK